MTTIFATVAVSLGLARFALFLALHVVRNDYNIVEHAVSDYAVGRTRALSSIMSWVTAVFWVALAVLVVSAFPDWKDLAGVTICLIALAAIFFVLPFLPTDLEGAASTTVGRLHLLAAIAWFALSYACMGNFARLLQPIAPAPLGSTLLITSWVALISLVALVAALAIRPARRYAFGISERIFLLSVNVFYVTAALGVITTR
ncbi:DUF998 domain-containing protein [Saxibacter everestensis]|uniref:DUF998 domain-containing protein n=1 Tax=Saxibacter everestensis TaxID=2909229 RepID=A0ABY8QT71_9MICO|nr:DUF998 domain-containing protein [Brevibacteriaceae bacterium ZFBP1038]